MYFFKNDEFQITKCLLSIDEVTLLSLRQMIIRDCSVIVERTVVRESKPTDSDSDKIFNITRGEFVGTYDEQQGPDHRMYKYHYMERQYSKMVGWIDALLKGDASVLKEIYAGKPKEVNSLQDEFVRLSEKNEATSSFDLDAKLAVLSEMKNVMAAMVTNKDMKPEFYYYDTLLSNLQPEPVSAIPREEFERTLKFIGKTPEELDMVFIDNLPAFGEVSPIGEKQM